MAENIGLTPPDYTTLAGKVRVLVGDTDPTPYDPDVPGYAEYAWYSDDELIALGEMFGENPKRVAIWVLSQVAVNMAMQLKKWTSEDLQVDGPAIAKGIEGILKRLSAEVALEDVQGGEQEFFGVYEREDTTYHGIRVVPIVGWSETWG